MLLEQITLLRREIGMEQGNTKKSIQDAVFSEIRYADSGDDPLEISIYAYSRNPAFLGFYLQYIGVLLMF